MEFVGQVEYVHNHKLSLSKLILSVAVYNCIDKVGCIQHYLPATPLTGKEYWNYHLNFKYLTKTRAYLDPFPPKVDLSRYKEGFNVSYNPFRIITKVFQQRRLGDKREHEHEIKRSIERSNQNNKKGLLAEQLIETVKILCLVMTEEAHHNTRAMSVKETWGKRCNKLIFVSTVEDIWLPAIVLPYYYVDSNLWVRTKIVFKYLNEQHPVDADWFLIIGDNTYVILENLRYMLSEYHSRAPIYFNLTIYTDQNYLLQNSNESEALPGYVLSSEALHLTKRLPYANFPNGPNEGNIADWMKIVKVKSMDFHDSQLRKRFLARMPEDFIIGNESIMVGEQPLFSSEGFECCSNNAVTFYNVSSEDMFVLEYLIYRLRLYNRVPTTFSEWMKNKDVLMMPQPEENVRIICMVLTYPPNHITKAIHVKNTWGKRCDKLLFMSSVDDPILPTVKLPVHENTIKFHLWHKTTAAFKYVYDNHLDDADWFLKADDDSYVIMENLRDFLSKYNTSHPTYFGLKMIWDYVSIYMDGGAGYVLSREALRRFGDLSRNKCRNQDDEAAEDITMGECLLGALNVTGIDTRDSLLRHRFFIQSPKRHIFKNTTDVFWNYSYYPINPGLNCCSDSAVSFHHMTPQAMYAMEYLTYHFRLYGTTEREYNSATEYVNNTNVL